MSPNGVFNDMGSPDYREAFAYATKDRNGFGLAYLHVMDGLGFGFHEMGEPMALAQVAVYSPENPDQPWATGQTNQEGEFEFSPDSAGNWDVVIRQAGHGTSVSVPVGMAQAQAGTASESSSPLQRWASAGAALWGLVGTALFFSRGKQS